jgi:hypothetical protein
MTKWLIRIFGPIAIAALVVVIVATTRAQMSQDRLAQYPSETPDVATGARVPPCSIATIAGKWVFTTDLMYTNQPVLDGTALGTMNVGINGTIDGTYDWEGPAGFAPATNYIGTVTVDPDCRGTFSWHDAGSTVMVVQSIVIAEGGREYWGIFQDPTIAVGTFRGKRITAPRD